MFKIAVELTLSSELYIQFLDMLNPKLGVGYKLSL